MLTEELNVKIGDFGLSKLKCLKNPFSGRIGTTHWMAPEVLRGEVYTDSADVYSFGSILWEMLNREIPFRNLSSVQIIGSVGFAGKILPESPGSLGTLAKV
jgi:serine/threonine protein kinase